MVLSEYCQGLLISKLHTTYNDISWPMPDRCLVYRAEGGERRTAYHDGLQWSWQLKGRLGRGKVVSCQRKLFQLHHHLQAFLGEVEHLGLSCADSNICGPTEIQTNDFIDSMNAQHIWILAAIYPGMLSVDFHFGGEIWHISATVRVLTQFVKLWA